MITKSQFFKPSVNIKLDKNNPILLKSYLPTPSHADAFSGVLNGFINPESSKSHIVIGAYGTGKSFLATLLSALLSKNIEKKTYKLLLKKYSTVNDEIHDSLQKVSKLKTTYIPILLNGNEGSFRQAIIKALLREINENQLDVVLPGVIQSIFDSVNKWKKDYPQTYKMFQQEAQREFGTFENFTIGVQGYNNKHIGWFKDIYPDLTSGSRFNITIDQDFISQIQYVIDQLNKKHLGIFFIYDEFGRFIQSLDQKQIHQAMQDIQDLAELCNSYSNQAHLLLITHKNLRNYSFKFNEELNDEFGRIEKRFVSYSINSDPSTFLRLSHEVISSFRQKYHVKADENYKDQMLSALRMFPLFPEFNNVEVENIVVDGSYPLHPVTIYMLPVLSNIFAQNERTLFTFLESNEAGGLVDHLKNEKGIYLPYKLFDYFFSSFSKDTIPEELKIYRKVIQKLPFDEDSLEVQLIKFIALWNISGLQAKFKLTDEFISFALDYNLLLNSQLNQLRDLKAIRFNRIYGYWELFNGSSVNVDEIIEEKDRELNLSKVKQLDLIQKFITPKYYLANEYNYQKSMTRFCSVLPIYASSLIEGIVDTEQLKKVNNADSILINVLLDNNTNKQDLVDKLLNWNDKDVIFAIPSFNYQLIEPSLRRYTIVTNLLEDKVFLQEDPDLRKELLLSLEDIEFEINEILLNYSSFKNEITWIFDNKKVLIKNKIVLENLLSDLMSKIYPYTPEVRNDAFNRRNITTVQKKAAIKVVDYIINHRTGSSFDIEGNGPDYLIYATLLKNNGIEINDLSNIQNEHISKLKEELINVISKNSQGTLHEITKIFTERPFGIRKPLIPILLVTLLKEHWNKILFYRNGMYISEVNGEFLYSMIEEETEFEYRYFEIKEKYYPVLHGVNQIFNEKQEDIPIYHPLYLQHVLLSWLRSLPRVAQITMNMSEQAVKFKEIIRYLEVDPQKSLDSLKRLFNENKFDLKSIKTEIETYYSRQEQFIKNELFKLTGTKNYEELWNWALDQSEEAKKNNNLIVTILNPKSHESIDELSFNVVGVERKDWSDTTFDMFISQINYWYEKLSEIRNENSVEIKFGDQTKVINNVRLTNKSELIYQNVNRIIKNAGRTVSKEEVESIVYKLVNEFIK